VCLVDYRRGVLAEGVRPRVLEAVGQFVDAV